MQNKLASLKREMASQLDKDPALASLVAGDIQRSVRTSESGADEASSMGECSFRHRIAILSPCQSVVEAVLVICIHWHY